MTSGTTERDEARELAVLGGRVDALETLAARSVAVAGALGVVLGAVLPYVVTDELGGSTLAGAPFDWSDVGDEVGSDAPGLLLFSVGFGGLLVVLLGCLWLFLRVAQRDGTQRTARVGRRFALIAACGSLVPVILWAGSVPRDDVSSGPGLPVLAVGLLLALALSSTHAGRRLWVADELPRPVPTGRPR